MQVGILRRGRFVKDKQVGKGPAAEVGDVVKRGQVRQLPLVQQSKVTNSSHINLLLCINYTRPGEDHVVNHGLLSLVGVIAGVPAVPSQEVMWKQQANVYVADGALRWYMGLCLLSVTLSHPPYMPCCAADAVLRGAAGHPLARGGAQRWRAGAV